MEQPVVVALSLKGTSYVMNRLNHIEGLSCQNGGALPFLCDLIVCVRGSGD